MNKKSRPNPSKTLLVKLNKTAAGIRNHTETIHNVNPEITPSGMDKLTHAVGKVYSAQGGNQRLQAVEGYEVRPVVTASPAPKEKSTPITPRKPFDPGKKRDILLTSSQIQKLGVAKIQEAIEVYLEADPEDTERKEQLIQVLAIIDIFNKSADVHFDKHLDTNFISRLIAPLLEAPTWSKTLIALFFHLKSYFEHKFWDKARGHYAKKKKADKQAKEQIEQTQVKTIVKEDKIIEITETIIFDNSAEILAKMDEENAAKGLHLLWRDSDFSLV